MTSRTTQPEILRPGTRPRSASGVHQRLGGGGGGAWRANLAPTPELLARVAALPPVRDVPEVEAPVTWAELCAGFGKVDRALVPWELAPGEPLRERLPAILAGARSVLVAIGPEGGLSHAEVERACAAGAVALSLGSRILRTETAGLVACAAVLYVSGDL